MTDMDLENSGGVAPASSLEEKYRESMRQIYSSKIDLPLLTLTTQVSQQINLRPDFQRRDRWNAKRQSRFIESIIMNVPIPPCFLGEEEYGKFVVLDGRQRLTAATLFMSNELRLVGLKVWEELNGLKYEDMKKEGLAPMIERRFLPAILLTRESSPQVKYDVFDRLNTGGVVATPMEVRNAIFPGPFNDLIRELSRLPRFRELWGIPRVDAEEDPRLAGNALFAKMVDLELVLRFFALRTQEIEMPFQDHLSSYMAEHNTACATDPSLVARERALFIRTIEGVYHVLGMDAFRRPKRGGRERPHRSQTYADAVMHSFADHDARAFGPDIVARIRANLSELEDSADFVKAAGSGTNSASAIATRIAMAKAAVRRAAQGV